MAFKRKMQIRSTPVDGIMAESSSEEEEIFVKEPQKQKRRRGQEWFEWGANQAANEADDEFEQ